MVNQSEAGKRTLEEAVKGDDPRAGKYLSFFLNKEEYGIGILKVQEIIGQMPITPVPRTPDFVRGVINLRGRIIPILDLKLKFGLGPTEVTEESCIIVAKTEKFMMGVLVDKVSEVLDIGSADIEDAPSFGDSVRTEFLLGLGKEAGRVKMLLDVEKALDFREMGELQRVAEAAH